MLLLQAAAAVGVAFWYVPAVSRHPEHLWWMVLGGLLAALAFAWQVAVPMQGGNHPVQATVVTLVLGALIWGPILWALSRIFV